MLLAANRAVRRMSSEPMFQSRIPLLKADCTDLESAVAVNKSIQDLQVEALKGGRHLCFGRCLTCVTCHKAG